MKNIIIGILFCLPLFSQAQIFQDTGYKSKALWATSLMKPPSDTLSHKQGIAIKQGVLYWGTGTSWVFAPLSSNTDSFFFFKSVYAKRTQSGRFVFNKTALAWDSLQSFKITDSTRSSSNKLYGHETKFIKGFEEAAYDSNYISRIKVNAATGVELSFSDQNNSDTNNIVKVDANGFTINIPSKGVGKVLQSDVNGNATWVVPAGGGGAATDTTNKFINSIAVKNDSVITYNRGGNFTDIPIKGATGRLTNSLLNYVDKTTAQTIGGIKTLTSTLNTQGINANANIDLRSGNSILFSNGANNNYSYITNFDDGGFQMFTGGVGKVLEISNLGIPKFLRLATGLTPPTTTGTTKMLISDATGVVSNLPINTLVGYTVATLPAGTIGMTAYVTDAAAPTYLGTLTGGGSVVTPVFRNATGWVSY